jgi:predicted heme/steroid binding protein
MSELSSYLGSVAGIAGAVAGMVFLIARISAWRDGKKLDAIRKERADLERQLRHLKPRFQ